MRNMSLNRYLLWDIKNEGRERLNVKNIESGRLRETIYDDALQEEDDETRGSEIERGSASKIREESKEHDKSEAVGAQGCDPTDPTSMPRPPSEPSLALLRTLTLTLSLRGWMEGGPAHFSHPTWLHVLIGYRPLALTSLPSAASDTDGVDGRVSSTWLLFPEKKSKRDGRRSGWNVNRSSIDSCL